MFEVQKYAYSAIPSLWCEGLRICIAVILAAASQAHAQNTHSAQLIRAQQQYFTAADSPSLNFGSGSMTAEAWVKVNAGAADTQDMAILEKRSAGDAAYMLYLANGGALYAEVGNGTSAQAAQTAQIDDGTWHHVAFTYDQSTLRLYLDGVERATQSVSGRDLSSSSTLFIGRSALSNSLHFDGFIDEVRLWSATRTGLQIQAEMTSKPTGAEPNLKAYWTFDNTPADSTSNGNTFAASNGAGFSSSTIPFAIPSILPTAGLITRYAFESDVNDVSGNGNHGSGSGALAYTTGKTGQALQLLGGNVNALPDTYLPEVTAACWVRMDYPPSGEHAVIDGWRNRENYFLWVKNVNGQIHAEAAFHEMINSTDGYPEMQVTSNAVLSTGEWTHLALSYGADHVLRLYVNGVLDSQIARTGTLSSAAATPQTDLRLGIDRNNGRIYQGFLDDVLIYNRALSAAEIAQLANTTPPTEIPFEIYKATFSPPTEIIPYPEWGGAYSNGNNQNFFLGYQQGGTTRLTLSNLPQHSKLQMKFNLVIFGLWNGNSIPDLWSWGLRNQTPFFSTTFAQPQSNEATGPQAYPGIFPGSSYPSKTGAVIFNQYSMPYPDSSYYLEKTFTHTGNTLEVDFSLANSTRRWGLDNVIVNVIAPPGPVSINGTVTSPIGTTDPVIVTLVGDNQTRTTQANGAGVFAFTSIPQGLTQYQLSAFVDSNGNNSWDTGEPKGAYQGNPLLALTNVIDANISIPVNDAINSGLRGYWKLDAVNGTVVADSSGNGAEGKLTGGGTWGTTDGRQSLYLDGSNDQVEISSSPAFNSPAFTLTGWVRSRDYVAHAAFASKGGYFRAWLNGSILYVDANGERVGGISLGKDRWYHIAISMGPNQRLVFIDGNQRIERSGQTLATNNTPLVFGNAPEEPDWQWRGDLADLRYYNRELSPAELAGTMTAAGVSGSVTYFGHVSGSLHVQAKAAGTTIEAALPSSGQYSFPDLLGGFAYGITAFFDSNGNGKRDTWEPSGSPTGSPLAINGSFLTNKDITITNPADTDTDGIADAYETAHGLTVGVNDALLDLDGDGLSNLREFLAGLKANVGDSDGDTTADAIELQQNGTLAYNADSDGDGMTDVFELANNLNPYNAGDAALDYDGDGLTNREEFNAGLNPRQRDSNTDGTSDYQLVKGGKFNRYYYDRTNRLTGAVYDNGTWMGWKYDGNSNIARQVVFTGFDADNDGLPDVWELQNGSSFASGTGSNGPNTDNDNDGWSNYQEYLAGTNPNDPLSAPSLAAGATSAVFQTPPLIRFIQPPATGGAHALLKIRLWDNESNPAAVKVQFFKTSTSEWKDAALIKVDNQPVTPTTKASSSQSGTNHDILWDALTDLGPTQNGLIYLRAWGQDFSAGAVSETTPYQIDTVGDFDGDGIPDAWEITHGLDPNSTTGINGTTGDGDHDGLNNFGEFVFGLNVNASDGDSASSTSTAINSADGKLYLTLTYRRRLDAAANGLTYHVQTSTDLVNWTANGVDVEAISTTPVGDGISELVLVRVKPPLSDSGAKKFVRVRVEK